MPPGTPFELPDAVSQQNPQIPDLHAGLSQAGSAAPSPAPTASHMDSLPTFSGISDHRSADLSSVPFGNEPAAQPVHQPAVPQPSPPPGPPPSGGVDPLGSALGSYGIDVTRFQSPRAAMDELIRLAHEGRENRQYAELGRRAAPHWDRFEEFQRGPAPQGQPAAQPAAQPQAAAPTAPQWTWSAPEWNPRWLDQIDPQTGRLRDGADPTILTKIATYQDWREQQLSDLFQDPAKLIHRAVEPKLHEMNASIEKLVSERTKAAIQEYHEQQRRASAQTAAEQRFSSLQDKLIAKDPSGQYARDPLTGEYNLTPQGRFYRSAYQSAVAEAQRIASLSGQKIDEAALDSYANDFAARQLEMTERSGAFGAPAQQQAAAAQAAIPAIQPPPAQAYDAIVAQRNRTFMEEALAMQPGRQRDGTVPDNPATGIPQSPMRAATKEELVARTLKELGHREDQIL